MPLGPTTIPELLRRGASTWPEVEQPGAALEFPALTEFLSARPAPFMLPRFLERIEAFPKTPTLRVQKHLLRELGNSAATFDRLTESSMSSLTTASGER